MNVTITDYIDKLFFTLSSTLSIDANKTTKIIFNPSKHLLIQNIVKGNKKYIVANNKCVKPDVYNNFDAEKTIFNI